MHPLLKRQLNRLGLDDSTPPSSNAGWSSFLKHISQSYLEADQGRDLLERSLTISSHEMRELYEHVKLVSQTELAQERNKLLAVLQSLGDGLCVIDVNGAIRRLNQQAEQLLGCSFAEIEGRSVFEFVSSGAQSRKGQGFFTDDVLSLLQSGRPYRTDDGQLRQKSGTVLPISLIVTPVITDSAVTAAVLVFRDISDRKRAEAQQANTESLLRRVQAGLSELAKSSHIYGGILPEAFQTVTKVAAQALNVERASIWFYSEDQASIVCANLYEHSTDRHSDGLRLPAVDYPRYFRALKAEAVIAATDARTDSRTSEFTNHYLIPLGITSMLDVPLRCAGSMVGVICHEHVGPTRDWTLEEQHFAASVANTVSLALEAADRKKAEDALRTSEARLAMTVQGSNTGIWDWDLMTNQTYFSHEWKSQLGYEEHELSSNFNEWHSRVHPDDRGRGQRTIEDYLSGRTTHFEFEHRLRHKNGSYRWILSRGSLIKNPSTLSQRMVGIHIDLTERKIAEEELRQAKEAAEAANIAKTQFLANMSHEIRTPLNGVLGMAELLLNSTLTERQRHLTETVLRSGRSLLSTINDILDVSKIEAGKLELEVAAFDLHEIVQDVIAVFVELTSKTTISLRHQIDSSVPRDLWGDALRVRQILLNLVGNAVKFTDQGEIVVSVTRKQTDAPDVMLYFEVRDTGIGIPEDSQPRIFEPFSQADTSTTRRFGGTGLGLTIVKQLVRMMRGEVGFTSIEGQGSTFWFTARFLNQGPETSSVAGRNREARRTGELSTTHAQRGRILVAEDNPVNREVARGMLELLGLEVDTVENGIQAVQVLSAQHYDLVLMDCQMPDMDGFAATREIRRLEAAAASENWAVGTGAGKTPPQSRSSISQSAEFDLRSCHHIPIIALTAHAMASDRATCLDAGMDDYLTKPFTQLQLESMLSRWLGTDRVPTSAPQEHPIDDEPTNSQDNGSPCVGQSARGERRTPPDFASLEAVDCSALDRIRAMQRPNRPDILTMVLNEFLKSAAEIMLELKGNLRSSNASGVQAAAHRLKSSSAQLGARALSARCRELETLAATGDMTNADTIFSDLEHAYEEACEVFQRQLASGAPSHG